MTTSRRNVLRSLGILGSVNCLPLSALRALHSDEELGAFDPNQLPVLVVFEGPWLFTSSGTNFVATTFGDLTQGLGTANIKIPHDCNVGGLDASNNLVAYPDPAGPGAVVSLGYDQVLTAGINGRTSLNGDFKTIMTNPLNKPTVPPVFVTPPAGTPFKLKPQPGDRQVTLPMPDGVYCGARLKTAIVYDNTGSTLIATPMQPCIATVLTYAQPAGSAVTSLSFSGGSLGGNGLTVTNKSPAIFRLNHKTMYDSSKPDQMQHLEGSFQELFSRIGANYKLGVSDNTIDESTVAGLPGKALGLDPAVYPSTGGKLVVHAHAQTYTNCAGGGGGGDCCN